MAGIILIHGAWAGSWVWQRLTPVLQRAGHQVMAPDMPGTGLDLAGKQKITMFDHLDHLAHLSDQFDGPVHLVAHGLSGIIITEFAERHPQTAASVTYFSSIFARPGVAPSGLPMDTPTTSSTTYTPTGDKIALTPEIAADLAFDDCTAEDRARFRNLMEQACYDPPIPPLDHPTGHWEKLPRAYFLCLRNKMVLRAQQQQMIRRHNCGPVIKMHTGHCPFLTQPDVVADHLDQIVKRAERAFQHGDRLDDEIPDRWRSDLDLHRL